ncbi:serine/threonine-protein phosphatase 6 regulatory ankyrin repeat subunit B [Cocos nucifera]|uniref:Serine/threonine-protein phosphatase 6 regulatory ankyrin repeat subunit B n=1 Tax=Cocos nucifera TaxID=13894 RepID=A0A8K0HZT6_COCNU|nr:serine/threonine-protein phosphatase 6 regulatory ankyrin repeat subunit B [Cocos nucifera]
MPESYFPLRWESTGDQWWYASPIDWAAANGHYDIVRELLYIDANLLIKLTSLRRIRRLETVWDDDVRFVDAAKCRSFVARNLFIECEKKNRKNSLIRAGYGGWLLYTAASAGDTSFVQELLERDKLLVFGEGEYGVTDIFYAAARSKNSEVFRLLFDSAVPPRCFVGGRKAVDGPGAGVSIFRWEMVNRAVHAAARGGNLDILKELLDGCSDVLDYRDVQGSTILHAAAGRGQVEVVKDLVASFDIISSRDNQGNIALHVAAFRGHLSVVEALISASPSSSTLRNNAGDTLLHMAVAGFGTPGFRRLDQQMELVKRLARGTIVDIQEIINLRNDDGRTALHIAVIGRMHSDLVELLMTVKSIDLNIPDADGLTPSDLLRQQPLIKQLSSAGGISNSKVYMARSAIASHARMRGIGNSPGTSFGVSDAEIFLYAGIEASETGGRPSSCSSASRSGLPNSGTISGQKKQISVNNAAKRLKILLSWHCLKAKKTRTPKLGDDDSVDSFKKWSEREEPPAPLRQRFCRGTSLPNNKRTLSVRSSMPSPAMKKKFSAGLMHGVIRAMPHLAPSTRFPSGSFSNSSTPSPASDKQKGIRSQDEPSGGGMIENLSHKPGFTNARLMNQYFCFGTQGLTVDDLVGGRPSSRTFKCSVPSMA